jgi:hypothetical protein
MIFSPLLISSMILLMVTWIMVYFRRHVVSWLKKHPLILKIGLIMALVALVILTLIPILVFIFHNCS